MRFVLTTLMMVFAANMFAQTEDIKVPHLVKKTLEKTGCSAYFPDDEELVLELSYAPDSSKVYTGEVVSDGYFFSLILVQLNGIEMTNLEEKESMLINYMDYLKESFSIVGSAGYGKGHRIESDPDAVGIIDYWEDIEGEPWAVKAWANKNTLAVMMLYGPNEYPLFNVQQLFLDGFRFN